MRKSLSTRLAVTLVCLTLFACPLLAQQGDQVAPLLAQMKSAQAATRAAAAKKLEPFATDERVIVAMIAACKDADPAVRKYAANNLGAAESAFICTWSSAASDVRKTAAFTWSPSTGSSPAPE